MEWFLKAAAQGHTDSQYALGEMYERGEGVKQDKGDAVEWYRKIALQGDRYCSLRLGILLIENSKSKTEKCNIVNQFLESGAVEYRSFIFKGLLYEYGIVVDKDIVQAEKLYRQAVKEEELGARRFLGLLLNGVSGAKPDADESRECLQKAAEEGDSIARICLWLTSLKGPQAHRDNNQAKEWWTKAISTKASKYKHKIIQRLILFMEAGYKWHKSLLYSFFPRLAVLPKNCFEMRGNTRPEDRHKLLSFIGEREKDNTLIRYINLTRKGELNYTKQIAYMLREGSQAPKSNILAEYWEQYIAEESKPLVTVMAATNNN